LHLKNLSLNSAFLRTHKRDVQEKTDGTLVTVLKNREPVAQTDRFPFDRLRANGHILKSFGFSFVLSLSKHEIGLANNPPETRQREGKLDHRKKEGYFD
jgi:hypothetical protein